jgi:predicted lipoprotein with Yx(FWY)xxD motif
MGRSLAAAVLVFAAACGETPGAAENVNTTSPAASAATVGAADSSLGPVLVDPNGMTLYVFTEDDGESTCYDACADLWPPVAAGPVLGDGMDGVVLGSTVRSDGSAQLTVNGRPVYLYAGDGSPGETRGQGIGRVWFAIGAGGEPVSEASTGTTTTVPSAPDDYGY